MHLLQVLLKEAKYSLTEWLDKTKGSTVTDSEISTKLFEHLELAFYKDMDALNVNIDVSQFFS